MLQSRNPYVFVTGCTRSGTTLLQRLLDNHPKLAVSNDTHVIPRALFGQHAGADTPLTAELFEQVTKYKRFAQLGIDLSTASALASNAATFAAFVSAVFDEYAKRRRKPLAGEKDPEYVRRLPLLRRLFPHARVLHIIRDGRDVALSTLDWVTPSRYLGQLPLWEAEPIAVCALWWHRQVSAGIEGGQILGDQYFEVRYEQLVSDPEPTLRTTCDFLEIKFDAAMLRYKEGPAHLDANRSPRPRWVSPTPGVRDWRASLQSRDLQLFQALAGDLLTALNYPLVPAGGPAEDIQDTADQCRQSWRFQTAPHAHRESRPSRPVAG